MKLLPFMVRSFGWGEVNLMQSYRGTRTGSLVGGPPLVESSLVGTSPLEEMHRLSFYPFSFLLFLLKKILITCMTSHPEIQPATKTWVDSRESL